MFSVLQSIYQRIKIFHTIPWRQRFSSLNQSERCTNLEPANKIRITQKFKNQNHHVRDICAYQKFSLTFRQNILELSFLNIKKV